MIDQFVDIPESTLVSNNNLLIECLVDYQSSVILPLVDIFKDMFVDRYVG